MSRGLQDEIGLHKGGSRIKDKAREKATEAQWQMTEAAIKAFSEKYPSIMKKFIEDTSRERDFSNQYAEGKHDDGKKMASEFRKTAVFPTINGIDRETGEVVVVDSLLPVLEGIIPGLTHKDSVNYAEFLKRFPIFSPSYKLNV